MPDIRCVSLSDLHLGEEDSLLTATGGDGRADLSGPSPVLKRLAECLAAVIGGNSAGAAKPALILNGDVLELALARQEEAALVFAHFLAETMPANSELFGEIICLAGNHDHHLWETAREAQYAGHLRRNAAAGGIDAPWHTTKTFVDTQSKDRLAHELLTAIAHRHSHLARAGLEILMAYPSFGLADADRGCVIFHHGHFIEPVYYLMSTVDTLLASGRELPATLEEMERENFAWIDFFWSAMGRSGQFGEDVERIYEASGDPRSLRGIMDTLAVNIARRYDLPLRLPEFAEEAALKALLRAVASGVARIQERQQTSDVLTASSRQGLRRFLEVLLPNHVRDKDGRAIPEPMTFVFGHTHKPFEESASLAGYARPAAILNQGGWVVDSRQPQPLCGGAIVLVDDELNAVSLRMYNEDRFEVRAAAAQPNPLLAHVEKLIARDPGPWRAFSETARVEVRERAENLASRSRRG